LKYQPMKEHESVLVFSKGTHKYFPIMQERKGSGASRVKYAHNASESSTGEANGSLKNTKKAGYARLRNPSSVQYFNNREGARGLHPTQKPVALFEYLIKTYTNKGETVLDNCMGSGTTAIACLNTDRQYIGFELDETYHKLSLERINNHKQQLSLIEV